MNELVINKIFNTYQELEAYEKQLSEKYVVFLIIRKDQDINKPDIYGIDKIIHFGERK